MFLIFLSFVSRQKKKGKRLLDTRFSEGVSSDKAQPHPDPPHWGWRKALFLLQTGNFLQIAEKFLKVLVEFYKMIFNHSGRKL